MILLSLGSLGSGSARHIGATQPVYRDARANLDKVAAQERGVSQTAAGRVQLDYEDVKEPPLKLGRNAPGVVGKSLEPVDPTT